MSLTILAAAVLAPPFPYAIQQRGIIDILIGYKAPPVETTLPRVARELPGPWDAAADYLSRRNQPSKVRIGPISHKLIQGPGGQILLRMYRPLNAPRGPLPAVVYFHGGGFVFGSLNAYDNSCRTLANMSGAIVVSVAYRLAPENPYPAAFDDAEAATKYVMNNAAALGIRPGKIAIAGESAGGNLATAVSYRLKEAGLPMPKHQLLVYPVTDWTRSTDATVEKYAKAAPLNKPMLGWFKKFAFANPEDAKKMDASPFLHPVDHLRGMPAATVVLAEIDPLRKQGMDYAAKLRQAGVSVGMREWKGVAHEFFGLAGAIPQATQAQMYAGMRLKAALR